MDILIFIYSWITVGVLSGLLLFFWSDKWKTLGHLLAWILVGVVFGYVVVFGIILYALIGLIEKSSVMEWLSIELKDPEEEKDIEKPVDE